MDRSGDNLAGGAHVASWSALEAMESGLARFRDHALQAIDRAMRGLRHRQSIVEQHRCQAEGRVDRARAAYEERDPEEDDGDYLERLQSAEEEFEEAERRCDEFRRAAEAFCAQAASFRRSVNEVVPAARCFVREKLGLLRDGHAVRLDGVSQAATGMPPQTTVRSEPTLEESGSPSLQGGDGFGACALPRGFVWVALGDIDLETELRDIQSPADFKHNVSYDMMRQGLERFRTQILPEIRRNVSIANSDYFWRQDQAAGADYEHGLQRIYDALFPSEDYIYLQRGRNQERFTVIKGRHRIKVAHDLGWSAIPAQVKDLNKNRKP